MEFGRGLALALLLVLVTAGCLPRGPSSTDPLGRGVSYLPSSSSVIIDPPAHATVGYTYLRNEAEEPAVIDTVSLSNATPGLDLVAAYTVPWSERKVGIEMAPQFPPDGWEDVPLTPAAGATIPHFEDTDETNTWLLLRLAVPHTAGVYEFESILVDYHVAGERYQLTVPFRGRICAPSDAWQSCGLPLGSTPLPAAPSNP